MVVSRRMDVPRLVSSTPFSRCPLPSDHSPTCFPYFLFSPLCLSPPASRSFSPIHHYSRLYAASTTLTRQLNRGYSVHNRRRHTECEKCSRDCARSEWDGECPSFGNVERVWLGSMPSETIRVDRSFGTFSYSSFRSTELTEHGQLSIRINQRLTQPMYFVRTWSFTSLIISFHSKF